MLLSHLLPFTFVSSNRSQPHASVAAGCRELARGSHVSDIMIVGLHRLLRSYFMPPHHQQADTLSVQKALLLRDFVMLMRMAQ